MRKKILRRSFFLRSARNEDLFFYYFFIIFLCGACNSKFVSAICFLKNHNAK